MVARLSSRKELAMASLTKSFKKEGRNIIVVGKTGCGKSTVGNRFLGVEPFKISSNPVSTSSAARPAMSSFIYNNVHYNLTVIDTIGFFDQKLTNYQIMKDIKDAIKKFVKGLHLIVFVVKEGRFTDEEKKTFDIIHNAFAVDIDPISAMVITGCEGKKKEVVIKAYQDDSVTKDMMSCMKKGIYPVGFPDLSKYSSPMREIYEEEAKRGEAELQRLVVGCDEMLLKDQLCNDSGCTVS